MIIQNRKFQLGEKVALLDEVLDNFSFACGIIVKYVDTLAMEPVYEIELDITRRRVLKSENALRRWTKI